MNERTYKKPAAELNLIGMIWELLSQWKLILIIAVIMGLLISGAKYMSDSRNYEASLAAKKDAQARTEMPLDERVTEVLSTLSAEDVRSVKRLAQKQEFANRQNRYLDNSILMNIDSTNQRRLVLNYYINAQDNDKAKDVADACTAYLHNDEVLEELKGVIAPDSDLVYIDELIVDRNNGDEGSLSDPAGALYTVEIILKEDNDASAVEAVIDKAVRKEFEQISGITGAAGIDLVGKEDGHYYDATVLEKYNEIINNAKDTRDFINDEKESLNGEQRIAFETIAGIFNETDNWEGSSEKGAEIKAIPPAFSKKHLILGLLLGIIIYVAAYIVISVMRGRVVSASNLNAYTNSRLLGEVYYKADYKGLKALLHSALVDRLRYRGVGDSKDQIKMTAGTARSVCDHYGAKDVMILDLCGSDNMCEEVISNIAEELKNNGLNVDVKKISGQFDEQILLSVKNAIFATQADTKAASLGEVEERCYNYDVNLLGNIYIGAY